MIILTLKTLSFLIRKLTPYSATALPGLYIEKYFPHLKTRLYEGIKSSIVVTGTNGKTTTTMMISAILKSRDIPFITNISGSNMSRGLLSTLVQNTNPITGYLRTSNAILEIEEASTPKIIKMISRGVDVFIVTNIFRDQLDAYGEITKTISYIKHAIKEANNPVLILNGDDKNISKLIKDTTNTVLLVKSRPDIKHLIKYESEIEPDTSSNTEYEENHIEVWIEKIKIISDDLNFSFDISIPNFNIDIKNIKLSTPGFHNAINATFALLASSQFLTKLPINESLSQLYKSTKILSEIKTPFGRGEIIQYKSTRFQSFLVKNPAGMNLNLKTLEGAIDRHSLIIILNDNIADGRDVSWIWDCDFSTLLKHPFQQIIVTGTRRYDMYLRLKYEGIQNIYSSSDIRTTLMALADALTPKVYILPTYTAMLNYRRVINKLNRNNEKY